MRRRYVVSWGMGESFYCEDIRTLMGQVLLVFLRGHTEMRLRIERAVD